MHPNDIRRAEQQASRTVTWDDLDNWVAPEINPSAPDAEVVKALAEYVSEEDICTGFGIDRAEFLRIINS